MVSNLGVMSVFKLLLCNALTGNIIRKNLFKLPITQFLFHTMENYCTKLTDLLNEVTHESGAKSDSSPDIMPNT